jgi:CRISPR-associated protein Cmr2
MPQLLNLSIGPVQDFIASARRCQDLWYGSWLLSELSKVAAEHLKSHGAETVIFPGGLADQASLGRASSVANKILAVIRGDAEAARMAADGAKAAMTHRLEELARAVFERAFQGLEGQEDVAEAKGMAWAQIQDLMEFQWVVVPFEGEGGYPEARDQAERLLMAVKNTKPWTQPSWSRPGWRKSSLDGARESVIPERQFTRGQGETEENLAERLYRQFRVKPAERLCGVGLLKRWGSDPAPDEQPRAFHSTSHMAAAALRARAESMKEIPAVRRAWEAYRALLRQAPFPGHCRVKGLSHGLFEDYDGSILYPGRVREIFFAGGDARKVTGPHADTCQQAEAALVDLLKALQVPEPNGYYALLLADGDHMGAAIDAQKRMTGHQKISTALDRFAMGAREVVARHGGSLIYSGGDDVLAMLPLHTCLDCAEQLARVFADGLAPFRLPAGGSPTLSVGIAIAHHLEDFADVRSWAGQAERLAKGERNSLALRLEKRGGSPVEAVGPWDPAGSPVAAVRNLEERKAGQVGFLTRLRGWIERHQAGEVPNSLPFQWAELVRLARDTPAMDPIVMLDARRLLGRKDEKAAGSRNVQALWDFLEHQTDPRVLEALSHELVLAKEIARALGQAVAPHRTQEA